MRFLLPPTADAALAPQDDGAFRNSQEGAQKTNKNRIPRNQSSQVLSMWMILYLSMSISKYSGVFSTEGGSHRLELVQQRY
jgi:hypothetical protein